MNPPLPPGQRRSRLVFAAALAGFLALFSQIPLPASGPSPVPLCGFHAASGLPCPLCGGTRAAQATLRGDFARAAYLNPLALPVVLTLAAAASLAFLEFWRGRPLADWPTHRVRVLPKLPWLLLAALLLWWPFHLFLALRTPKPELLNLRNPIAHAARERLAPPRAGSPGS